MQKFTFNTLKGRVTVSPTLSLSWCTSQVFIIFMDSSWAKEADLDLTDHQPALGERPGSLPAETDSSANEQNPAQVANHPDSDEKSEDIGQAPSLWGKKKECSK